MKLLKGLIVWLSIFSWSTTLSSQIYLQLERSGWTETIRFYEGDYLQFKLKEFPKTWRSEEILSIKPEENILVFEDNFYNINQIHSIRINKNWAKAIGPKLMLFSAAWFTYGGIATLASGEGGYKMSSNEIVIGGIIASVGFFIKTLFSKKKFKLNKRKRLRIMDLRMNVNNP